MASTQLRIFVSPKGNDGWSGTAREVNRARGAGPVATLHRALELVREARASRSAPPREISITLARGDYVLSRGLVVDRSLLGKGPCALAIRAQAGEKVRILGGVPITGFRPVSDQRVRERFAPGARQHIVEADLKEAGIADAGRFSSRGFGRKVEAAHLELFYRGQPMTVARWPNEGFLTMAGYPEGAGIPDDHRGTIGALDQGFLYEGDRPKSWASTENIWVHGYWAWDWANSYEEVESIDTERRLVKTKPPRGHYGFRKGNRFFFLNVLEELDAPGEYYVDAKSGTLYFWPPGGMKGAEVLASVVEDPLLTLDETEGITIEGIRWEAARGRGIVVKGGRDNTVQGCAFHNLGTTAVTVEGGTGHRVLSCDMSGMGEGGISLVGGDRQTLTSSRQEAANNHIWAIGRWSRTYCPAVEARGVGMRVAHNLIHDLPHIGIVYWGNEMRIEYNHIHHATLETGDAGAIYTGRDYTARGNVVRFNYIHDMGGYGMGTMGVYLDDCVSGQTIYGNVFVRVQRAAFIGGGRDITVENNIFVECSPAVAVDARGLDKSPVWHNMVYKFMKGRLDEVKHHKPPYSVRYPELKQLDRYYARDDGVPPEGNVVARNVSVASTWMDSGWHSVAAKYLTLADNVVTDTRHFVDASTGDYRFKKSSPLLSLGFEQIPFREIGLVKDRFRKVLDKPATAPHRPWKP